MDFDGFFKSGSQEDESLGKMRSLDGTNAEINGGLRHEKRSQIGATTEPAIREETGIWSAPVDSKVNGNATGAEDSVGTPSSTPQAATKGHGLKKWRRMRRDSSKDESSRTDTSQILKRRLSHPEPQKGREENKQKSGVEGESSVASGDLRTVVEAPIAVAVADAAEALEPALGLLMAAARFSIGADSENSEDRSSKSSTAASAPRMRGEVVGCGRERGRAKASGGKGSAHVVQQRTPRGRVVDSSKKFRGEKGKAEGENSYSSVESDMRSSNVASIRRGSVVNGKHSDRSVYYEGEQSDDEAQRSEEVRSDYYKDNGGTENLVRKDFDAETLEDNVQRSDNSHLHPATDPFVESIVSLQTAQEVLEREIQKLIEIGKDSIDSFETQCEETGWSNTPNPMADVLELNQKIMHLECKLEESSDTIKEKESKIVELKVQEKRNEMQGEIDCLLEEKIATEIQCLIMSRTTQIWKLRAEDQIALYEQQKSLAGDLRNTENKAVSLKEQAEKLEMNCKELSGTAEVLRLQNRACKLSIFCFIELVMLCVAAVLYIMQLLPPDSEVVPT